MSEQRESNTDTMIRATAADNLVRCMAAVTTETVKEAATRHDTTHTVTAALGRTLTGTLLLGAGFKEFDRLTVKVECDGPVGGITAETNTRGEVRGYVRNPRADETLYTDGSYLLNEHGKLSVSTIVGHGMLHVSYESGFDIGFQYAPYSGSVPLVSGEIGEDFAYYLAKSEQIPSGVLIGVLVRARETGETFVEAAGGVIIQMMPGADERIVRAIEASAQSAPHMTTLIRAGARPTDLLRSVLGAVEFEVLGERPVRFACTCSYARARSIISSIDEGQIEEMLREDRGAKMTCHFCNSTYEIDEATLAGILQSKTGEVS